MLHVDSRAQKEVTEIFLLLAMASKKREKCFRVTTFDLVTLIQTLQRLSTTTNSVLHFTFSLFCCCKEYSSKSYVSSHFINYTVFIFHPATGIHTHVHYVQLFTVTIWSPSHQQHRWLAQYHEPPYPWPLLTMLTPSNATQNTNSRWTLLRTRTIKTTTNQMTYQMKVP